MLVGLVVNGKDSNVVFGVTVMLVDDEAELLKSPDVMTDCSFWDAGASKS